MSKSDCIACEQCGGELKLFKEDGTQGLKCAGCDWSVVTTHVADIKLDEVEYNVGCVGDYKNEVHIRVVSEVAGCNFLVSRKKLQCGHFLVFIGQAEEVLRVRNALVSVGLVCSISPDFYWG
ncbi:hypothetical protein [Pseudomonas sp. Tri1]|uniref:hypothetical protein n=1 Tax=Pseudomonas sp. Tri1 TaxID=2823875 RepID=UPI001B33959F|nr:hypothetical protein [Pseudomonas sp. Tri1]